MDSTMHFTGKTNSYITGRPAYPLEIIERLYSEYGFLADSVIADIGSGTGKLSKQLLCKGSEVFCVEPNEDMRTAAEKELNIFPNFHSVNGTAANTGLLSRSIDFITSAQAFHWFDVQTFQTECNRILKTGGKAVLMWNVRNVDSRLNRECCDIYKKLCPGFKGFSGGMEPGDKRIQDFFNGTYETAVCDNPLYYDKSGFINRGLSCSYSLKEDDENYNYYIQLHELLFEKYNINGLLCMENKTIAYIGVPG